MSIDWMYRAYTTSSLFFGILAIALFAWKPAFVAYNGRRLVPSVRTMQSLLVVQTITSTIVDVLLFPECVSPRARWWVQTALWIDRSCAMALALSQTLNALHMPLADTLICATMGFTCLACYQAGRRAFARHDLRSYYLWHTAWHTLPLWWLMWLVGGSWHEHET